MAGPSDGSGESGDENCENNDKPEFIESRRCQKCKKGISERAQILECVQCSEIGHFRCMKKTTRGVQCVRCYADDKEANEITNRDFICVRLIQELKEAQQRVIDLEIENRKLMSIINTMEENSSPKRGGEEETERRGEQLTEPKQNMCEVVHRKGTLIVKPKEGDNSKPDKLTKMIKENVNPAELQAEVISIKETKTGNVIIECPNITSARKIQTRMEEKIGEKVSVTETEKKFQIKVETSDTEMIELMQNMNNEEIEKEVMKHNNLGILREKLHVKIKMKRVSRKADWARVIFEVNETTRDYIMKKKDGKLAMGWEMCDVQKYTEVIHCYKCQAYGHKANRCKALGMYCKFCANNHDWAQCRSTNPYCVNCNRWNRNNPTEPPLNCYHRAHSGACVIFQNTKERLEMKQI
jgi:hypothetical protein